jgi:hypothetical protein
VLFFVPLGSNSTLLGGTPTSSHPEFEGAPLPIPAPGLFNYLLADSNSRSAAL